MKTVEAVREIMKEQNIGVNKMADRLNRKPNVISERLGQSNISIVKLSEMLRVLDYKIMLVPRKLQHRRAVTKLNKGSLGSLFQTFPYNFSYICAYITRVLEKSRY